MSNVQAGSTYQFKKRGPGGRVESTTTVEVTSVHPMGRGKQVTFKRGKSIESLSLGKFEKAIA